MNWFRFENTYSKLIEKYKKEELEDGFLLK